jgi:hypothetical protein
MELGVQFRLGLHSYGSFTLTPTPPVPKYKDSNRDYVRSKMSESTLQICP